jgi:hypothetical protein
MGVGDRRSKDVPSTGDPPTGGDQVGVDGQVVPRRDAQPVFHDRAAVAGQVEVRVVGQVDHGGGVGGRGVVVVDLRAAHGEGDRDLQRAREPVLPRRAGAAQGDRTRPVGLDDDRIRREDLPVEPVGPAVQRGAVLVARDVVAHAVDAERAPRDAVRVAADRGAEIGLVVRITCRVQPEDDVAVRSVAVRRSEQRQPRAQCGDASLEDRAAEVDQRIRGGWCIEDRVHPHRVAAPARRLVHTS